MFVEIVSTSIYIQFDNSASGSQSANPTVNNRRQLRQEFQQLGQDLASGELAAAQSDYATLQSLMPQNSSSDSSSTNSALEQDFKQLGSDLGAGNLSAAQQDYAKLKQDFQSQIGGVWSHHHHHHHFDNDGASQSGLSEIVKAFEQLGKALQSGDL